MSNPKNNPSRHGYSVHGRKSALTSSEFDLNLPAEETFSYGVHEATLSHNSVFPSQNQAFPVLDQHLGETGNRLSNPVAPFGLHVHRTSNPCNLKPQNTANLSFIVRNNSSTYCNLLSRKPSYQMAKKNPFAPSSSTHSEQNIVSNPESLNFKKPSPALHSYREATVKRVPETPERPRPIHTFFQSVELYSQPSAVNDISNPESVNFKQPSPVLHSHREPTVKTLKRVPESLERHRPIHTYFQSVNLNNQPSPVNNVCNPETLNFKQPSPALNSYREPTTKKVPEALERPRPIHTYFQSVNLDNQPSQDLNPEEHTHPPGFPCPIPHENSVPIQSNLSAPECHPVKEEVSDSTQAFVPNFNHNMLPHSPHQGKPSHPFTTIPCPIRTFSQSRMDLGIFNQPFRNLPTEEPDYPPGFPSPIQTQTKNQLLPPDGEPGIRHQKSVHTQSNLPAPEIHPIKEEETESTKTPEPNFNHNLPSHFPHQRKPSYPYPCPCPTPCPIQNYFQSRLGLGLFNQPSKNFPTEEPDHPPGFPRQICTPAKSQVLGPYGGHGILLEIPVHYQQDFPVSDNQPIKEELGGPEKAPEANSNDNSLLQKENLQVPSQNEKETATTELNLQARKCRRSPMRRKSHPNKKYGPYTCHICNVAYENPHRYSAHFQKHYKGETPAEKKKRRERKIKNRDLHIAWCKNGITIMPGSQLRDKEKVELKVGDGKTKKTSGRQTSSFLKIKEEE